MKPYIRKFSENTNRFPAPEGFEKVYTGGNIYKYARTLDNGMYVQLFGADDIQEGDEGFDLGGVNVAQLLPSQDAVEHGDIREEKTFKTRAELDAILSQWEKGQIEHVTVICEEDNYQRKLLVEYGDYTGRVVEGPDGVNLVVDWDETPENWEDIDEAIQHSNIMNLEDGENEEIKI